jgi:Zn-dependent M28 family amino/carboxypeptidase
MNELTSLGWVPMLAAYPSGANVYAMLPATVTTSHQIIVGAHFDTVPGSPGANDDATGVAAVLAVARYLTDAPCRNAAVTVILFDEEEAGLFGSRAAANTLSAQQADVIAVHTIDQIGWDGDGDRRFEIELPTTQLEADYQAAAAVIGVPVTTTTTTGTDHQSFRAAGFPSVGLTEEYVGGDTSPYRHTPQDTAATVNPDYLVAGAQLVAQVVLTEVTR